MMYFGRWLARIIGLLGVIAGVVFFALYTAQRTGTLRAEQIRCPIDGRGDSPSKRVATQL